MGLVRHWNRLPGEVMDASCKTSHKLQMTIQSDKMVSVIFEIN